MSTYKTGATCPICTPRDNPPGKCKCKCKCCNFQAYTKKHSFCCRLCLVSKGEKHGKKCMGIIHQSPEPTRQIVINEKNITAIISRYTITKELSEILLYTLLFFIDYSQSNIGDHIFCLHKHIQDAVSNFPSELIESILIYTIESYYKSKNYVKLMKDICLSSKYTLQTFKKHPQLFQFDTEEKADTFSKMIEDKLGMLTLLVKAPLKKKTQTLFEYVEEHGIDDIARAQIGFLNCRCSDCLNKTHEVDNDYFDYEELKTCDDSSDIILGYEPDGDKHFVLIFNKDNKIYYKCLELWFYDGKERLLLQENDFLGITVKERIPTDDIFHQLTDGIVGEQVICKPGKGMINTYNKEMLKTINYTGDDPTVTSNDNNYYYVDGNQVANYINLTFHTPLTWQSGADPHWLAGSDSPWPDLPIQNVSAFIRFLRQGGYYKK